MDLVSLGEILIDIIQVDDEIKYNPGGAPLNLSSTISKYGLKSSFIGKVGNDSYGKMIVDYLRNYDLDTSGISFDSSNTTLAYVKVVNNERYFKFDRSADINLSISDIDNNIDLIKGCKIFHFGSLSLTDDPSKSATLYAIKKAREFNKVITFDVNYRESLWKEKDTKIINDVLEYVDILKVSDDEAYLLTNEKDLDKQLDILSNKVKLVIITLGSNGSIYKMNDKSGKVGSIKVNVVDPTGAGDIYFGTFLYEYLINDMLLDDESIIKYMEKASIASGISVTRYGAISSIPSIEEVESYE